ncbi:hypothetical protein DAI22_10g175900 [Oryza sativa Japonica Group]|nr:hypothetical protein DAI22_10g175900 [Oryza sativa Japonica Group]
MIFSPLSPQPREDRDQHERARADADAAARAPQPAPAACGRVPPCARRGFVVERAERAAACGSIHPEFRERATLCTGRRVAVEIACWLGPAMGPWAHKPGKNFARGTHAEPFIHFHWGPPARPVRESLVGGVPWTEYGTWAQCCGCTVGSETIPSPY